MKYEVVNPDYNLSPYTGMTREHWIHLCHFFLEGIFRHVKGEHDPILVPRQETAISYPQPGGPSWRLAAERFEGLARSFLIAAPLLCAEPEAVVCGRSMKDYYKDQILRSVTPGTPQYLMSIEEIRPQGNPGELAFQHTCECASLVIGLTMCKDVVWDCYTREEQDLIAVYLRSFGASHTGHHNWRLFNMLILAFLHQEGYDIPKDMMRDHAQAIVSYYAGDGWYRDGHLFDNYCPWAFHVYGPLWNQWYGYEQEPWLAERIDSYCKTLLETYPEMFDREAQVTMWGRSSSYRSAAAAPLASVYLLKNPERAPGFAGLARRLVSGSVLQFATREECFYEGIPCLGFYGPFEPMIQSYSCAASPFWMANSFLCLALPGDHPFWTETEHNGDWDTYLSTTQKDAVTTRVLDGPGIVIDRHEGNGITEFRTGKILMEKSNPGLNGYMRLSFNSHFPWEKFGYTEPAESMVYLLRYDGQEKGLIPNICMYAGTKEGVLYRKIYFDFAFTFQDMASMDLADIPVGLGILHVDKVRIPQKPYELTLGAYGLPVGEPAAITMRTCPLTGARAVIASSSWGQVAMVAYEGFDRLHSHERSGMNPVCDYSHLIYGSSRKERYYEYSPYVLISAVLTKKDQSEWKDAELFPVASIRMTDPQRCGGYGPITLILKNGTEYTIDYEGKEGRLQI